MFDMKLWESFNGLKTNTNLIEKHEGSITRKKLVWNQHLDPTMVASLLKDFKLLDVVRIYSRFQEKYFE